MDKEELLIIEPIIGYRAWDIYCVKEKDKFSFRLKGAGVGRKAGFWIKGINKAKCLKDDDNIKPNYPIMEEVIKKVSNKHKVPDFNCECGFYAKKYKIDIIRDLFNLNDLDYFCGIVEFTGKVIEHSIGYRAEKAEIKKLIWCRDEDKISLSYEDKDEKIKEKEEKEKEKKEKEEKEKEEKKSNKKENQIGGIINDPHNPISVSLSFPNSFYQSMQNIQNTFQGFNFGVGWTMKPSKIFNKDKILKQISDYYQVPIIYYKDYLEKELLK